MLKLVWQVALAIFLFASRPVQAQQAAPSPAETILLNGKLLTLDDRSSILEAAAISGGLIVATGSTTHIQTFAGAHTRIVDLGGRTVIPGLIDSHIHAIRAGLRFSTEVSWIGAASIVEAMDRIRQVMLYAKPGSWIVVGGGWTPGQFAEGRRPTASEITAAAPDYPVFIQLFYSAAYVSPAGQQALGIADGTLLPTGAKFDVSPDQEQSPHREEQRSGWISGNVGAITGLYARLPQPTLSQGIAGTRHFFRELNRFGVTGVIDPGGHNLAPQEYEALFRLWRAGELTVRIAYSICAPRPGFEFADLQLLTRFLPMSVGDDLLRFNGIGERVTWGLYNNDTPSEMQKEEFFSVAKWAAEKGMTLTVHWNNDKSVHHLLDIFERVDREIPIRALRWSVAHLHDASDASLGRMKALGVGWLMQNGLHFATASYLAASGSKINRSPPIRTALQLGLPVGGGTDAHRVMSYNPFKSLQWMIDGRTVEGIPTRAPSELVSREQALRLYTQGSAWFSFDEARRGTIVPGQRADLAVLDGDYLAVPVAEISQLQSLLTMVGGRIVFAAGPFKELEAQGK